MKCQPPFGVRENHGHQPEPSVSCADAANIHKRSTGYTVVNTFTPPAATIIKPLARPADRRPIVAYGSDGSDGNRTADDNLENS